MYWVRSHPNLASFTTWLLSEEEGGMKLTADPDPPTFYQTLGKRCGGMAMYNSSSHVVLPAFSYKFTQ